MSLVSLFNSTYGNPPIKTPQGEKKCINMDVIASGYPSRVVDKYLEEHILPYYNNTHSNAFAGQLMSKYIALSRKTLRKELNCHSNDEIIFTGNGCSGAITHLIHVLNLNHEHTGVQKPVVFITITEHHSNYLPWKHLPIDLVELKIDSFGLIDIKQYQEELKKYQDREVKIASFSAASNVTGIKQPVRFLSRLTHQYGGLIFFDYAASAPYVKIDMHINDAMGEYFDGIMFSPHKFIGGPGSPGILIANQKVFRNPIPYFPSGGTVRFVAPEYQTYSSKNEIRETGGTPNILGCIRVGLAIMLKSRYQDKIIEREKELVKKVDGFLRSIPGLYLLNPKHNRNRLPVFAFIIEKMHYNLVVVLLNDLFGLQTRGGVSCCSVLAQHLLHLTDDQRDHIYHNIIDGKGVAKEYGWCRVSFHYSLPDYIVTYTLKAIMFVAHYKDILKTQYVYHPDSNHWEFKSQDSKIKEDTSLNWEFNPVKAKNVTPKELHTQLQDALKYVKSL